MSNDLYAIINEAQKVINENQTLTLKKENQNSLNSSDVDMIKSNMEEGKPGDNLVDRNGKTLPETFIIYISKEIIQTATKVRSGSTLIQEWNIRDRKVTGIFVNVSNIMKYCK